MQEKNTDKKEIKSLISFPENYNNRGRFESSDDFVYNLENFIRDLRVLLRFYQKPPDKIAKSLEVFDIDNIKIRYKDVKTKF